MVKLSKLYTRQGDKGKTALLGGHQVSKNDIQVEAYGTVDELNSWIGMICAQLKENRESELRSLRQVQQELFDLGAELAVPKESDWTPPSQIEKEEIKRLESEIDSWTEPVPELKSFLLPGGSELTSSIHIARTVCRRAERIVSTQAEQLPLRPELLQYLNRLSDWLFALARYVAHQQSEEEILWDIERKQ